LATFPPVPSLAFLSCCVVPPSAPSSPVVHFHFWSCCMSRHHLWCLFYPSRHHHHLGHPHQAYLFPSLPFIFPFSESHLIDLSSSTSLFIFSLFSGGDFVQHCTNHHISPHLQVSITIKSQQQQWCVCDMEGGGGGGGDAVHVVPVFLTYWGNGGSSPHRCPPSPHHTQRV